MRKTISTLAFATAAFLAASLAPAPAEAGIAFKLGKNRHERSYHGTHQTNRYYGHGKAYSYGRDRGYRQHRDRGYGIRRHRSYGRHGSKGWQQSRVFRNHGYSGRGFGRHHRRY